MVCLFPRTERFDRTKPLPSVKRSPLPRPGWAKVRPCLLPQGRAPHGPPALFQPLSRAGNGEPAAGTLRTAGSLWERCGARRDRSRGGTRPSRAFAALAFPPGCPLPPSGVAKVCQLGSRLKLAPWLGAPQSRLSLRLAWCRVPSMALVPLRVLLSEQPARRLPEQDRSRQGACRAEPEPRAWAPPPPLR